MNFAYIVPRFFRHILPDSIAEWMKRHEIIIKAGIETRDPTAAASRYLVQLEKQGLKIRGKNILLFGYGGNLVTACELLNSGASSIFLSEQEGFQNLEINNTLLEKYPDFFTVSDNGIIVNSEKIQIFHEDIRNLKANRNIQSVDYVLSSSVFEHLNDVEGITRALHELTKKGGKHVHFVDLRDHYFKYPFEMLTYNSFAWKYFLNPTSNLNRYRIKDYKAAFSSSFKSTNIEIEESDTVNFQKAKARIKDEFLSGDFKMDSATQIIIIATA